MVFSKIMFFQNGLNKSIIRRQHPCILLEYFRKVSHTCITHGFSRLLDRNIGIAAYQFFRIFYADFRHEVNIFLSRLFVEQLAEIGGGQIKIFAHISNADILCIILVYKIFDNCYIKIPQWFVMGQFRRRGMQLFDKAGKVIRRK